MSGKYKDPNYHATYYERVTKPARHAARQPAERATLDAGAVKCTVRLPATLHAYVVEQAAAHHRTLNAEIVRRLLASADQGISQSS